MFALASFQQNDDLVAAATSSGPKPGVPATTWNTGKPLRVLNGVGGRETPPSEFRQSRSHRDAASKSQNPGGIQNIIFHIQRGAHCDSMMTDR